MYHILGICASGLIFLIFLWRFIWGRKKLKSLENAHVLVTGGSSGIGKSIAIEAAKRGANITIIARDSVKLEAAKSEVLKHCVFPEKQRVQYISLDVSCNYDVIEKALHDAEEDLGPVYMLVNCAGMAICGRVEDVSVQDAQLMMNLNFFGALYPTMALLPRMKSRQGGMIVLVASMSSMLGIYGFATYSATKFALRGFAEALHMEVGPYNISVTLALPPDTDTPGFERESKSKPLETKLISQSGGLYKPDVVAKQIIKDSLNGNFFSTVGFEGFMLATGCAGMAPVSSFMELLLQVFLMGPLRLISVCYLFSFHRLIRNCMKNRDKTKKSE